MGVGGCPELRGTGAEDFGVGLELNVHLQTYDGFVLHLYLLKF